jgi:serine/threonine-protein phosphatase PP1 catalytic subunit
VGTFGFPSDTCGEHYLFLGDYVDCGDNLIETIVLLLCMKVIFPKQVFLLRGNHESKEMTEHYGFRDDCIQNYSEELWHQFLAVFDCLPLAALVGGRIYCVHGGLSPSLLDPFDLDDVIRPHQLPDAGPTLDILWSDPSNGTEEFVKGDRGASWKFGQAAVENFLRHNHFDLICRAHECVNDGLAFPFEPQKTVVTVFSATDYGHFFHNKGAMLNVTAELVCGATILAPTI